MAASPMLGPQDQLGLPRKNWMIAQAMLGNAEWRMAGMRVFLQKYFYFLETKTNGGNAQHAHDWFEFSQLICGRMEYSDSQRTAAFKPGDIFFMSAGLEHSWRAITLPLVISSFQLKLSPLEPSGTRVLAALRAASSQHEFRLGHTGRLRPIARRWWLELSEPRQSPLLRERLLAHFQIFFATFLESVVGDSLREIRDPGEMPPPATRLAKTTQMTAFIQQNLHTSIHVKDLASHFDYSVRHIQRMFLADFGVPVGHYIIDQKLQLAQRLLAVSRDPIKSVAIQVGLGDSGRFCRAFRRHLAMSPRQYRESVRSTLDPNPVS